MTRKDFELIARAFTNTRAGLEAHTSGIYPNAAREQAAIGCLAEVLADELAATSPRFDRARFLAACGCGDECR